MWTHFWINWRQSDKGYRKCISTQRFLCLRFYWNCVLLVPGPLQLQSLWQSRATHARGWVSWWLFKQAGNPHVFSTAEGAGYSHYRDDTRERYNLWSWSGKNANITIIFRKVEKEDYRNNRLVSITPVPRKTAEQLLLEIISGTWRRSTCLGTISALFQNKTCLTNLIAFWG